MAEGSPIGRLYVLAGPDVARSFDVRERALVGRADECDVRLSHRSISRKHALVARSGEAWYVQDLGSTNGVVKGGQRVERAELADGDEFLLGDLPLRFRVVSVPEGAGPEDLDFAPAGAVAAPAPPAPAARPRPARSRAAPVDPGAEDEVEIELAEEIAIGEEAPRSALEATTFSAARSPRRTGFFAGELEQQPLWLRGLLVLFLLALSAGLFFGAFKAVQFLRASL